MSDTTDVITIRVPKHLKEQLEKTSKKNHLNLNALINQILVKKMHWDEQLTSLGWLPFDPYTIREILKYLTEDEIVNVSKISQKKIIKGIQFIYGDTDLGTVADFIDTWLKDANMIFRHTADLDSHKFIVHHELGKNWSILATKITEGYVKELGYQITDLDEKEDSYSFTITK